MGKKWTINYNTLAPLGGSVDRNIILYTNKVVGLIPR